MEMGILPRRRLGVATGRGKPAWPALLTHAASGLWVVGCGAGAPISRLEVLVGCGLKRWLQRWWVAVGACGLRSVLADQALPAR